MWKKGGLSFLVVFVASVFMINEAPAQQTKTSKSGLPSIIAIGTTGIGGAANIMATSLGEVLNEKYGIKVRPIPIGAEKPRALLLRNGGAQFCIFGGNQVVDLQWGLEDYATYGWGPQALQMVWLGPAYLSMSTTRSHTDINSIKDVKGKRVSFLAHKSAARLSAAFLAFAGLTPHDVVQVNIPSFVLQFKALMAGQIDVAALTNPMAPILYEVQASPEGFKWLQLPADDKEGWERLRKIEPSGRPGRVTLGPGLSKEKPLECFNSGYPIVTTENQNPELVYMLTKTIYENLERLKEMSKTWQVYTRKLALDSVGWPHSYHQGAVKFFKEKGLWTSEDEQWNEKQIDLEQRLKKAWEGFIDEATTKKWSDKEVKQRWHQRQKEITGYEPLVWGNG